MPTSHSNTELRDLVVALSENTDVLIGAIREARTYLSEVAELSGTAQTAVAQYGKTTFPAIQKVVDNLNIVLSKNTTALSKVLTEISSRFP